jgi:hypothetical protein
VLEIGHIHGCQGYFIDAEDHGGCEEPVKCEFCEARGNVRCGHDKVQQLNEGYGISHDFALVVSILILITIYTNSGIYFVGF